MEIKLAEHAGFCFGVTRAVETVYDLTKEKGKIYTYGPIIHNENVVEDLEKKGVQVIESKEGLEKITDGTVVIRSHGVSGDVYEQIEQQGLKCVDATCPFVKRIHKLVDEESGKGDTIIVIGNSKHPEVEGIVSYAHGPVYVVETVEEARALTAGADENGNSSPLKKDEKLFIVSQTTFNSKKFQDCIAIFDKKGYNITVVNTICNATEERQTEAASIAETVDAMIVIGGASSSNTRKLYEICQTKCANTYLVQTADDLPVQFPNGVESVGITAGASTPKNIIEEVQTYVRTRAFV